MTSQGRDEPVEGYSVRDDTALNQVYPLSSPAIPKLDGVVETSTGDIPPIRTERDVIHLLLMTRQPRHWFLDRVAGFRGILDVLRWPKEKGVVVGAGDEHLWLSGDVFVVSRQGEGSSWKEALVRYDG